MSFVFVKATPSDIPYLLSVREQTMSEHLIRAGRNLTTEEHMQRVLHRYELAHIIELEGVNIGALKYNASSVPVQVLQLQIAPSFQNRGYGTKILRQLITTHPDAGVSLSVLKENPALQLYLRMGFQRVDEDALEYHLRYPAQQAADNNKKV
ncbi:GNAT family N-acetyltransferase [Alteromonas antoniana]|uniref:GNAT family N-acetyltransferase n=1 Tax=Alteromonas antoniana TaxID=2803813 RepID=UPI001C48D226|nr:GNAT family N-acetyltransferase [Alteromonas antoniana]